MNYFSDDFSRVGRQVFTQPSKLHGLRITHTHTSENVGSVLYCVIIITMQIAMIHNTAGCNVVSSMMKKRSREDQI